MCNCYGHKCECCEERIPMHIGDFAYPEEDFKCWCGKHVTDAEPGAVIFTLTTACKVDPRIYPTGWKCAIKGPEVGGNGDNHPNLAAKWTEEVVSERLL